jgi:hypothetical protein
MKRHTGEGLGILEPYYRCYQTCGMRRYFTWAIYWS